MIKKKKTTYFAFPSIQGSSRIRAFEFIYYPRAKFIFLRHLKKWFYVPKMEIYGSSRITYLHILYFSTLLLSIIRITKKHLAQIFENETDELLSWPSLLNDKFPWNLELRDMWWISVAVNRCSFDLESPGSCNEDTPFAS